MPGLRGVDGIDAKTAGLIGRAREDCEIQAHFASLYAKRSGMESRVSAIRLTIKLRYFFGVGADEVAEGGAFFDFAAASLRVKDQCASAFLPPIFASTLTEQVSPCSDWVTW